MNDPAVCMDGLKLLADLLEHLENGVPLSEDSARSTADAIRHAAYSGDSIDVALGLSRAGRFNSVQARIAKTRRDEFLCNAIRAMGDGDISNWECCKRLAPKMRGFAAGSDWRCTRLANAPPNDWPSWKRWLWWARSTDLELPTSSRQLLDIVLESAVCNPRKEGAKMLASKLFPSMQNANTDPERHH